MKCQQPSVEKLLRIHLVSRDAPTVAPELSLLLQQLALLLSCPLSLLFQR